MRLYVRPAGIVVMCVLGTALMIGCNSSGSGDSSGTGILRAGLPPAAKMVAEGPTTLTYVPEEPGQVYLYDVKQDRVIGRFHLRRGQRFAMDGVAGRATIDGNEVRIGETKKEGTYQVYFLPAPIE
jgi:hypothetical protein